jgi:transcription-repair coupling factor (superfamily II helicase)
MGELGMETGMVSRNANESYVEDCTIETDQPALIPDSYIDITNEKIRIYKQLDSMTNDKEIDKMRINVSDRFGMLPPEVENLFIVVKVRNLGAKLGFEKIIIKNGLMIMFFIGNPLSPYYKSKVFDKVIGNINAHSGLFNLKQNENKLKIVLKGVDSLDKAHALLEKLQ